MYLKNVTGFNQQFKASGHSFTIRPGQTVSMTMDEYHDHTTQFLIARGVLKVMGDDEGLQQMVAQADEAQAKADANKLEVNKAAEDTTKQVMMAQCAATKKDGERCGNNVAVKMGEYDENTPYFCGTHKKESAEDYEKVDGSWRKKLVVEPEPEPIVEPEPEPIAEPEPEVEPVVESETESVKDEPKVEEPPISDEDIAEALAEALEEEE